MAAKETAATTRDSGQILSQMADTFLVIGQEQEALTFYQQALQFRERTLGTSHPLTASCQNFVAAAHQQSGRKQEALTAYQATIISMVEGFSDTNVLHNPIASLTPAYPRHLIEALAGKGALLLEQGEEEGAEPFIDAAASTLDLAVFHLDKFRTSPVSESAKIFWSQKAIPLLENAVRVHYLLYNRTNDLSHFNQAFYLSEKARSLLLMAQLQSEAASQFAGVPNEIIAKEKDLQTSLLDYQQKITNEEKRCSEASQNRLDLWREAYAKLVVENEKLQSELQRDYPKYHALKYQPSSNSIAELEKLLKKEKAALIECFEGDQYWYIFCLADNSTQI
ncbi:MAG: tetratricopeptide repeat protein, partial [Bacteroidota bacterium]